MDSDLRGETMSATRQQLELQSNRIEMVLASYKAPGRVTGGIVTPRVVQFHLSPAAGTRVGKVQALADELALALGVANVRVSRRGSSMELEIPRDDARPVKLLPLMARLAQAQPPAGALYTTQSELKMLPGTAVLGMCDDGAPLLIRLPSPDVAHVLISGTTGSGKTALCQTLILSLAMTHRRSQLQFVLVDPKQRAFAPLVTLPHLMRPIIGDAVEAASVLEGLVRLMETRGQASRGEGGVVPGWRVGYTPEGALHTPPKGVLPPGALYTTRPSGVETARPARKRNAAQAINDAQGRQGALGASRTENWGVEPRIVVVLDELADLMQVAGKTLADPLTRLAQRGREAGIHVVACTQKPSSQVIGTLTRANFPVRLVGKVVSPEDARVAAGIGGTGAERLAGHGDFIAVAAGQILRFQGAFVSAAEMEQVVAQMSVLGTTRSPQLWDVLRGRPSLLQQAAAMLARVS
jgi:S-DNA-T family DNA segregation ATPase FtsK/SpoIIIE